MSAYQRHFDNYMELHPQDDFDDFDYRLEEDEEDFIPTPSNDGYDDFDYCEPEDVEYEDESEVVDDEEFSLLSKIY